MFLGLNYSNIPNGNEDAKLGCRQGLKIIINPRLNNVSVVHNIFKKAKFTLPSVKSANLG